MGKGTWKEADALGIYPEKLSGKPDVYAAAVTVLELVKMLIPASSNGRQGGRASVLLAALSVLFEEDFGGDDSYAAMMRVQSRIKERPKSIEELKALGHVNKESIQ